MWAQTHFSLGPCEVLQAAGPRWCYRIYWMPGESWHVWVCFLPQHLDKWPRVSLGKLRGKLIVLLLLLLCSRSYSRTLVLSTFDWFLIWELAVVQELAFSWGKLGKPLNSLGVYLLPLEAPLYFDLLHLLGLESRGRGGVSCRAMSSEEVIIESQTSLDREEGLLLLQRRWDFRGLVFPVSLGILQCPHPNIQGPSHSLAITPQLYHGSPQEAGKSMHLVILPPAGLEFRCGFGEWLSGCRR
jgi:hypothetical protein